MRLIRLGAACLNQTPLDWSGNLSRVRAAVAEARAAGVGLLTLPEMCLSGYGCEDAFHGPELAERAWASLEALAADCSGIAVAVGLPIEHRGAVYNAVALLVDGEISGLVAKRHLAGDGVHYEPRWFKAWPSGARATMRAPGGRELPLGDRIFELGGVRVGFEICEEAWVARRPGAEAARRGVDVVLNPSASHFAFGKQAVRERFVLEGARAFGVAYVYANLVGNESGRIIFEGGCLIAAGGAVLARGPRLSFADHVLSTAVVDVDLGHAQRARSASFEVEPATDPDGTVTVPFRWPAAAPTAATEDRSAACAMPDQREQDFSRAVALGLFDYMRRSRTRGFVVSLSGGADSAAVVVLCRLAVALARDELGPSGLAERLSYLGDLPLDDLDAMMGRLITTVYQGTDHSSAVTRDAAAAVAAGAGTRHIVWNVQHLVDAYEAMVGPSLGRPLSWERDDIALQNVQARARAPGVWMLANVESKLLLATSNRSEAAVGYATMDGDTCGGLSPVAGIDKAFLRRWLRWMEHVGPFGHGPLPELAAVNAQVPTAELRPSDQGQTDEGDLMPYPVLDAIERAAIRDKHGPASVHTLMCARFPDRAPALLAEWVARFFRLWCRNQWKRERYAPSFHLDDENLDPKSWCRFPILSAGYETELRDLLASVRA